MKNRLVLLLLAAALLLLTLPAFAGDEYYRHCPLCGTDTLQIISGNGNGTHTFSCFHCGTPTGTGNCDGAWTPATDGSECRKDCTVCGNTSVKAHSFTGMAALEAGHCPRCADCGYEQTASLAGHTFTAYAADDNQHRLRCSVCGYEQAAAFPHVFLLYDSDETGHWHKCFVCGYGQTTVSSAHTFDGYGGNETAHWPQCSVCGYGQASAAADHTFEYVINEDEHWLRCTVCGYETAHSGHGFSEYASDDAHHRLKCADCGYEQAESAEHVFTEYAGVDDVMHCSRCSVCGYERTGELSLHTFDALGANENGHFPKCSACGYERTADTAGHEFTLYCLDDVSHALICSVCSYIDTVSTPHAFNAADQMNGTHQMRCVCGIALSDPEAHSFVWAEKDGRHTLVCSVCGAADTTGAHKAGRGSSVQCTLKACQHSHSYSGWTPTGERAHKGRCACGDKETVFCTYARFTLKGTDYEICPVCGSIRGAADASVTRVKGAKVAFTEGKIPGTSPDVLLIELGDGTCLLSLGFDYEGVAVLSGSKPCACTLTLPADTLPAAAEIIPLSGESPSTAAESDGSAGIRCSFGTQTFCLFTVQK